MAALRTTPFYVGDYIGPGPITLYTVPAGHRIIIRSINLYNYANVGVGATIAVPGVVTLFSRVLPAAGSSGNPLNYQPWIVLGPGTVIGGYADTGKRIGALISGSLLFI